jgi:ABC-type nitrate/sulfonate/bicarbonate transport system substrate-binding protein
MTLTSRRNFVAGAAAAGVVARAGRFAAAATSIGVGYFPGISALPLAIAAQRGLFAREGLDVTATPVTGSVDLFVGLDTGRFAIAHTAFDNPVAYDAGRGDPRVASRDFCTFLGVDDGLLRLVARPGITRMIDLIGGSVGVDALGTGFTYALRGMLEGVGAGIGPNPVRYVVHGGTQQRAQGLMEGRFDATLLYPPFDVAAAAAGYSLLPKVTDVFGRYQGISVVARRSWIAANRAAAVGYARAYLAAVREAERDRAAAVAILASSLGIPTAIASASYDAAFARDEGFQRGGRLDADGMRTVLRLRARYAPPGGGSDPYAYVDGSVFDALR